MFLRRHSSTFHDIILSHQILGYEENYSLLDFLKGGGAAQCAALI